MHFYKRHIGDYAKKTATLSITEHGAYALLLDWQYDNECELPETASDIYRLCRAVTKAERAAVDKVRTLFFPGGWNKRAKEELGICLILQEKRRFAAIKKNHPDWTQEQVQAWCKDPANALQVQVLRRYRWSDIQDTKTPRHQDTTIKNKEGGGVEPHLPESVSDEAVVKFSTEWPGEMASGTPPMVASWVSEFLKRINGRREWPQDWRRYMVACWRSEHRTWTFSAKPEGQGGFEKTGVKKPASISVAQRRFELDRELASVRARLDSAYNLNVAPDEADEQREREITAELAAFSPAATQEVA